MIWFLTLLAACGGTDPGDATFAAWGSSTSSINLIWVPVDGATGYAVEREGNDTIMLDATSADYLDRGLAPGTYRYRLTALGSEVVQEVEVATSEDAAIITGEDPPIGAPIDTTIGRAGGSAELAGVRVAVPADALPDGATLTLQQIAAPTSTDDLALDLAIDELPARPLTISFDGALDVAVKEADGTWLSTEVTSDGSRSTVTLPMERGRASARYRRQFVIFRRYRIAPERIDVRANQVRALNAQAVFSDDMCEIGSVNWMCMPSVPRPIVEYRRVKNKEGMWTLRGPGRLEGGPNEYAKSYFAPNARPSPSRYAIEFQPNKPGQSVAIAHVHFLGGEYRLKFHYEHGGDVLGYDLLGDVTDEFELVADISETTGSRLIQPPTNATSTVTNQRPQEAGTSVTATSPFELVTVTSATIHYSNNSLTLIVEGTSRMSDTLVTFQGGQTVPFPGGSAPSTLGLTIDDIDLAAVTEPKEFPVAFTAWKVTISPNPELP